MDYASFLAAKAVVDPDTGIPDPGALHPDMFGFQSDITRWALRRGRAAMFEGTGLGKTLQYRNAREDADEAHISPLQLDVIERCIALWSLPGEIVFTPFMGIGSEVWCAARMGRKGIGIELKATYFAQAVRNLSTVHDADESVSMLDAAE